MEELIFNVTQEEGGYVAVAVGASIATQGETWDELCFMVLDAVKGYFCDSRPSAAFDCSSMSNRCLPSREGAA